MEVQLTEWTGQLCEAELSHELLEWAAAENKHLQQVITSCNTEIARFLPDGVAMPCGIDAMHGMHVSYYYFLHFNFLKAITVIASQHVVLHLKMGDITWAYTSARVHNECLYSTCAH